MGCEGRSRRRSEPEPCEVIGKSTRTFTPSEESSIGGECAGKKDLGAALQHGLGAVACEER